MEKTVGKKYDAFLNGLKADWKDEIWKEYGDEAENSEVSEYIQYLYPYYFKILDKTGTELKLPEDVQVYVNIYDHNVAEQQETGQHVSKIGRHESGYVRVSEDSEVYCNKEKECLAVATGAEKCGLYTLVQLSDKEKQNCSCGSTEKMDLLMHGIVRSFIMHWKKCAIAEVRKSPLQNMRYPVMVYGKHFMRRVADVWQRQEKKECFMMTVK